MGRNRVERRLLGRVGNAWASVVLVGAVAFGGWTAERSVLAAEKAASSAVASAEIGASRLVLLEFADPGDANAARIEPLLNEMRRKNYPIRRVERDASGAALFERFSIETTPTFALIVDGKEIDRCVARDESEAVLRNQLLRLFRRGREELAEKKKSEPKKPSKIEKKTEKTKKTDETELVRGQSAENWRNWDRWGRQDETTNAANGGGFESYSTPEPNFSAEIPAQNPVAPPIPAISPIDAATVRLVVGNAAENPSVGTGVVVHLNESCGEALVVSSGRLFAGRPEGASSPITLTVADAATGLTATVPGENVFCDFETDVSFVAFDVPRGLIVRPAAFLPSNAASIQVGEIAATGVRPETGATNATRRQVLSLDRFRFDPKTANGDAAARPTFNYLQVSSAPEPESRGAGLFVERAGRAYLAGICVAGSAERGDSLFLPLAVVEQTLQIRENLAVVSREQRAGKFDVAAAFPQDSTATARNGASGPIRPTNYEPKSNVALNAGLAGNSFAPNAETAERRRVAPENAGVEADSNAELFEAGLDALRQKSLEGAEIICVVNWGSSNGETPRETEVVRLPRRGAANVENAGNAAGVPIENVGATRRAPVRASSTFPEGTLLR